MHLFTYGTLMFPEVWQAVVGRPFDSAPGTVTGYSVFRVRDAVYPGLVAGPADGAVPGVVYFDVDGAALARLDRFEDDHYLRQSLSVSCEDSRLVSAEAYVVPPEKRREFVTDEPWLASEFASRGDLARFLARFEGFGRLDEAR